ncbi:class I SAM-dependent methyltransferase [Nocardioides guangzhouensis]|uniref:Class I SAM-dependent methyltransferase n=1 Tax=Nocardioides guangzhouensis TaxID=2497878 RepID=A0A4Q4ZIB5_9ACTN|nr:class I SAM-dependent methyltransferase [Nocardioides guangzhouensis]RYP88027.1 class I SAM-dependent methyltransferase [Nocardioides guangzhouensis]
MRSRVAGDRGRPSGAGTSGAGARVPGVVETVTRQHVVGWVSVPAEAPPLRVHLHVGRLRVASTYATPDDSMSGVKAGRGRRDAPPSAAPAAARPTQRKRKDPAIPRPRGDRRNSLRQVRTFSFRVHGLWAYVRPGTRITVRVQGNPLPINGHGMYLTPRQKGKHTVAELREKLDQGHVLTQFGTIELSKKLDTAWQQAVLRLYHQTAKVLQEEFDVELFFVYGTLLGAVREGGWIGHDVDFDAAYVSRHDTGEAAADELQRIALALIEHGFDVVAHPFALHVHDAEDPSRRIDIFHTWFDRSGALRFPFGVAGTGTVTRDDWKGTKPVTLPGGDGLVPANDVQMVAHLYGDDWRNPKPGFTWDLERTDSAPDGLLTTAQRTKVYWANFYSHNRYTSGSTFFEFVNAWPEMAQNVLDIGCGDGRDSCAFGGAGRRVLGVDQSPVGIEHASSQAAERGIDDRVRFRTCDVTDIDDLGRALDEFTATGSEPVAFYMRFFLHAIPEVAQAGLMAAIDAHARPGDWLVAEFRTDKDENQAKVHSRHYRRFQNAETFRLSLVDLGFEVLHFEESRGLSPYKGEDPVLCRVVARR